MAARLAEELPVLLRERPWEGATLVVDGAPRLDHHRDAEVVVAPPVAPRAL